MLREIDEDGDISILIDEFAPGLSQCLKKSKADDPYPPCVAGGAP
jgi:hypothetical protein